METREGYKKTKIGWIPEHWDLLSIKDFTNVITGSTPPTKDIHNFGDKYPWITPSDIKDSKNIKESERQLSDKGFQISRKLPKNTVLVTCIASIGKNVVLEAEGSCNQQINAILPSSNHNSDFLYYWFEQNTQTMINLAGQTAVQIINKGVFQKIPLPLPPLPEQQKIASILTTVDDKISSIDQQIQQTVLLKKGLMEKLLTKGIGHTEFKDTKIGRIPVSWDVVKVENLGDVITGSTPKTSNNEFYNNGSRLWASPADLGTNKYVKNTIKKLSPLGFQKTRRLPSNSLLVTCIGSTIGKIGVAFEEMSTNQQINAIACNSEGFHYDCYYYILLRLSATIKQLSATQAVPILNKKDFSNIAIAKIPYLEQKQIATILSTVDDKIDVLQSKKTAYTTLKKGLMAQLLTGHMRVKL